MPHPSTVATAHEQRAAAAAAEVLDQIAIRIVAQSISAPTSRYADHGAPEGPTRTETVLIGAKGRCACPSLGYEAMWQRAER